MPHDPSTTQWHPPPRQLDDEEVDPEDALEEGDVRAGGVRCAAASGAAGERRRGMMELGVTSLDEVRQRIAELHRELDERER